jgi:hypothetical protein
MVTMIDDELSESVAQKVGVESTQYVDNEPSCVIPGDSTEGPGGRALSKKLVLKEPIFECCGMIAVFGSAVVGGFVLTAQMNGLDPFREIATS